jgi:hypothetical protein
MMWLLLACGSSDPVPLPNAPPSPPSLLALADPTVVTVNGTVSEVHGATRSWLVTGDGQRIVAVLGENGIIEKDGRPAMVGDLVDAATITVTGKQYGDVVVVQRATVVPAAALVPLTGVVEAAAPAGTAPAATPTAGAATPTPPAAAPPPAAPPAAPAPSSAPPSSPAPGG